jgi:hypothetical protein
VYRSGRGRNCQCQVEGSVTSFGSRYSGVLYQGFKYLHGLNQANISVSFMKLKFCSLGTLRPTINWAVSEVHFLR